MSLDKLLECSEKHQKAAAALAVATERAADCRRSVVHAEGVLSDTEEAAALLQSLSQRCQEAAHSRISGIVTRCLAAVFPEPYEFVIEFKKSRGRTEAVLKFVRDGRALGAGEGVEGGVLDVAAFALRLAAMLLSRPAVRRLIVLDEPFKWVDEVNRVALCGVLHSLAEELGVQFVMVTHMPELQTGKVVRL